jgi:S1-C subfamily serine protease
VADEQFDLCSLDVSGFDAPAVAIGSIEMVQTGERVFAIGAPLGLDLTISEGIVSSLRDMPQGRVIQTSAPVSPGSSGGGLFDAQARLVGIVTFQTRSGQNLNFAVPADWIAQMSNRSAPSGAADETAERQGAEPVTPGLEPMVPRQ